MKYPVKMACCLRSREEHQEGYIVDVEQILRDYIWDAFKESRPTWQKICLRRKDFVIDVPMNYFHFDKIDQDVRPRQRPEKPPVQPQPSLAANMRHMDQQAVRSNMYSNSNVMALNTNFANCTGNPQTYTFRFEKTRKASLKVTFQRGFTVGGKVNLTIGLPKVTSDSNVSGGVDMQVNISKSTEETIEETLTWEATSEIQVSKRSNYSAKVLLSEDPVSYNFTVITRMSMPVWAAPCTVRRKNNDFSWTKAVDNLEEVFKKHKDRGVLKISEEVVMQRDGDPRKLHSIIFKTTGIIEGVRLSDQKILLEETELPAGRVHQMGGNSPQIRPTLMTDTSNVPFMDENRREGNVAISAGRLSGSPQSITICSIPEIPEDDGGVTGLERREEESHQQSFFPHARASPSAGGIVPPPRITTTAASSQASSPLSDTGSPDISECSRKSETITTV